MLVLIDGNHMAHRAYHATAALTRSSDGFPVGAVLGFSSMLFALVNEPWFNEVTHGAVVFDAGGKTFRHDLFPAYKPSRSHPDDLGRQYDAIRDASRAFGFHVVEQSGTEADDIIATLIEQFAREVVIVSSDKDLCQLVGPTVSMYDTMKKNRDERWIGPNEVRKRWLVTPRQIPDLLALMGDSVDGVIGIEGIGPVKAATLISKYGAAERVVQAARLRPNDWPYKALLETVGEAADIVALSKKLVTLKRHVLLTVEPLDLQMNPIDVPTLLSFLRSMGFNYLPARVTEKWGIPA